jgi:hypothetical protein
LKTVGSFGERFCALLLSSAKRARGKKSICRMPQEIGLITDGKFGDAAADRGPFHPAAAAEDQRPADRLYSRVFQKPFSPEKLSEKLKEVIAGEP